MSHFTVAVITEGCNDETLERVLAPYQQNNMDDCPREYLQFFEDDDCDVDEETGKKGCWENPNAKWDWYQVGGRWRGMLKLKPNITSGMSLAEIMGNAYDYAKVSDIDFELMKSTNLKTLEPYVDCFERKLYKPGYFLKRYPTKEDYIKAKTEFSTYAVITPDGKWHESGPMGWFGISLSGEKEAKEFRQDYWKSFIEPAIQNGHYITIVDCHI